MRKLLLGALALSLLASTVTVPAFAQLGVEVGPGGVGVEVGRDRDYRRDRDYGDRRYEERRVYRDDDRFERRRFRDCRTVTVRTRMPDGDVVVRRERRC